MKKGSREVGVRPYSEDVWRSLIAEYNIAMSGQKPAEKEVSLSELLDKHFRDHEYIMQRLPTILGYASLKQAEAPKNEGFQQKTFYLKLPKPEKGFFEDMLDMLNPFSIFSPDAFHASIELNCPNPECRKPLRIRDDWNEVSCIHCGSLLKIQWIE